jgi:hypothetical protein
LINPRILLRLMLLSLAAAAVVGAAGVLMGGTEVVGQTVGMLVLLAVCTALLLWSTRGLADPKSRAAALLATLLITIEFLLGLVAIWDQGRLIGFRSETLVEIMFILLGTGLPACLCLRIIHQPQAAVASVGGIILCSLVLLFWLFCLHVDSWEWWLGTNSLLGIGTLAVLCLVGVGTDGWHWRWIGVVCAGAAYAIVVWQLSHGLDHSIAVTMLICASAVTAHANVALRCPLKPGQKWIAYGGLAAMAATAVFVTLIAFEEQSGSSGSSVVNGPSLYERLASASAILAACATLALVILWRINQKTTQGSRPIAGALDVAMLQVALICPVCQRKQTLGKSGAACPGCGLRMKIILEEPRCQSCGYSLLMITSGRCPECGASTADVPIAIA